MDETHSAPRRNTTRGVKTLEVLAEAYLAHAQHELDTTTFKGYQTTVGQFVAFAGGTTPVSDITDLLIARFLRARLDAGRAQMTVRSDYRRLRYGFLSWCVKRGLLRRNPAALVRQPTEPEEPGRSVDQQTFGRLLAHTRDGMAPNRDRAVLWLLWDTGMRIGEVAQLTVRDVSFERCEIRIRAVTTKTDTERWVAFSENTRLALYDYLAFERGNDPGPLFLSLRTGDGMTGPTMSRLVREIARLAGVKASPHDFRRAFVERMQAQGMPDTLLQQLTGHRSTQMIVRYGRRKASENALRLQRQYMGGVG